ncbi:uncharacterized protein LOC127792428 isoform X4 [Diospyros lotus]|uniref:uncharacterized protein LOC127792428 isoform X4 n=1 Tax=Diospyros lotus TaxID=55363 RepID=UPI00225BC78A|nr:uncharacterized protein LOC127792428 isoform X4 [Diospyros lotus]
MEKRGKSSRTKLNIAIIHPDLGIGGAERLIVDAAVELASHGHNVHIFTAHHDKNRCFEETLSGCVLLPFSRFVACSTYNTSQKDIPETHRLYRRNNHCKFTASTFANTFKHLDARGIKPAVLYPAVNVDQFDRPHASKLNFLSINRFERKKNIELAISAFAMLHTLEDDAPQTHNVADVTLTVVGGFDKRLKENVEYLEELKTLAEREGVSHQVYFMTSCSTADRNALLSDCLCVLYTPKDEHFGIVPLEAMAAHKPVIACKSGGPVETVKDGVTGFLCDPTPQAFCSAMAKLIQEPQLAERMGAEAKRHVTESFSTKIFGRRLNQIVIDIAGWKSE